MMDEHGGKYLKESRQLFMFCWIFKQEQLINISVGEELNNYKQAELLPIFSVSVCLLSESVEVLVRLL